MANLVSQFADELLQKPFAEWSGTRNKVEVVLNAHAFTTASISHGRRIGPELVLGEQTLECRLHANEIDDPLVELLLASYAKQENCDQQGFQPGKRRAFNHFHEVMVRPAQPGSAEFAGLCFCSIKGLGLLPLQPIREDC